MADFSRHYGGVGELGGAPPTGPGNRTNVFASQELLEFARAHEIWTPVCKKLRVPMNTAETGSWRRIAVLPLESTDLDEITEGVNPEWQSIDYEDVEKTFEERVEIYAVTSRARTLSEDDHVANSIEYLKDKVLRIRTAVKWNVFLAGSAVLYNNPSHTTRAEVDGPVTIGILEEAIRILQANKAKVFHEVDHGGINQGTVPLEPTYLSTSHTDIQPDLRKVDDYVTVAQYGGRKQIHDLERGAVENLRFLLSPELTPFADAGAAVGTTNMKSTTGTNIDVYPILIFGQEAVGSADLIGKGKDGYGGVNVNIVSGPDKYDPADLNHLAVAHWWDCDLILNDSWMLRVEVGATDDLTA